MGYDIYIGQAELRIDDEQDAKWRYQIVVYQLELPEAPQFLNEWQPGSNYRGIGYSEFERFTARTGTTALFKELLHQHPGICALTEEHYATLKAARERYEQSVMDKVPGFTPPLPPLAALSAREAERVRAAHERECAALNVDADLARILHFEWWMRWALDNCSRPAIYNC